MIKHSKNSTKPNTKQHGFTIIEVVLYLAITGLVIMIGFNAVGGRTAQAQFTDSMRGIQSYVANQYNQFEAGVMPYENAGCRYDDSSDVPEYGADIVSDGSCVLFGKFIIFESAKDGADVDDTVAKVYNAVGRNIDESDFGPEFEDCNTRSFKCMDVYIIEREDGEYVPPEVQLLWGSRFVMGNNNRYGMFGNNWHPLDPTFVNRQNDNIRGLGWIREPLTNNIQSVAIGGNSSGGSSPNFNVSDLYDSSKYEAHYDIDVPSVDAYEANPDDYDKDITGYKFAFTEQFNAAYCFIGSNGQWAQLLIGEGESKLVPSLTFEKETVQHVCS